MKQSGSDVYTPPDIPEMEIEFDFERGQVQTRHQPGYGTDIEITNIKIYGHDVSERLFDILMESDGDHWIGLILNLEGKSNEYL